MMRAKYLDFKQVLEICYGGNKNLDFYAGTYFQNILRRTGFIILCRSLKLSLAQCSFWPK